MRDMNDIVWGHDIVLLTLDTLRYDVAQNELEQGRLPVFSRYFSSWEPRHSPAGFTYAAHHAFFAGFLPTPVNEPMAPRLMATEFSDSQSVSPQTRVFNTANIVEGLAIDGYYTLCIGGDSFFNKQTPLGNVLPGLFQESYWAEETGVTSPGSTCHQIDQAIAMLDKRGRDRKAFLFMNISAIHHPNYFYHGDKVRRGIKQDDIDSHAAALRYVDSQLARLFEYFSIRRNTLFIICSDHGTCYEEDGHHLAYKTVWTVPYAEFVVRAR